MLPDYPIKALRKAQPGWVLVTFSVSTAGVVRNAQVTDSSPEGLFGNSALKAIAGTKYPPSDSTREGCSKLVEFNIGRWAD